jgi:hypothetical protein
LSRVHLDEQIGIRDQDVEIEYTCPIGPTGNRRNEILSIGKIGSRGRTRPFVLCICNDLLLHFEGVATLNTN